MKKKSILVAAIAVMLVAALVVGGTLAYFTDKSEVQDNVFTVGNVKIGIREVFDKDSAVLIPGKDINKDVFVKNTGAQDAYVRVHIAIPSALDDGDPSFVAAHNFLHFNFTNASVAAGQWSWIPRMTDGEGYLGNGAGNWNFYTTTVDGVDYNVYVVTYRSILPAGEETQTQALDKVYLDRSVDAVQGDDGSCTYKDDKGNSITLGAEDNVKVLVVAEGVQAEGFNNAYTALNTAFGTPGTAKYVSPFNK